MLNYRHVLLTTASVFLLNGCLTDSDSGSINLGITDAPVDDASAVYVQFLGVDLHSAKNEDVSITFDTPKRINLLDLQGSDSEPLLSGQSLAAGDYQWIKLSVDTSAGASVIVINGAEHDLSIPSGSESGLKLVRGFTVPAGGSADFTIDFDLRKSINESRGDYKLKPALRLIDNVTVGHIKGTVDGTLLSSNSCGDKGAAVYVFEGHSATPDDVNTVSGDTVITTAMVKHNTDSNAYEYELGFLSAGNYTVALTCEADSDDAAQTDNINFISNADVTVEDKKTLSYDFSAS